MSSRGKKRLGGAMLVCLLASTHQTAAQISGGVGNQSPVNSVAGHNEQGTVFQVAGRRELHAPGMRIVDPEDNPLGEVGIRASDLWRIDPELSLFGGNPPDGGGRLTWDGPPFLDLPQFDDERAVVTRQSGVPTPTPATGLLVGIGGVATLGRRRRS